MRRLDDQNNFQLELQKSIFADNLALFEDDIAFKELISQNERDYQKSLAHINIDEAIALASQTARNNAITNTVNAAGSITTAAINAPEKKEEEGEGGLLDSLGGGLLG